MFDGALDHDLLTATCYFCYNYESVPVHAKRTNVKKKKPRRQLNENRKYKNAMCILRSRRVHCVSFIWLCKCPCELNALWVICLRPRSRSIVFVVGIICVRQKNNSFCILSVFTLLYFTISFLFCLLPFRCRMNGLRATDNQIDVPFRLDSIDSSVV